MPSDENVDYALALSKMDDKQAQRDAETERHRITVEGQVRSAKAAVAKTRWEAIGTVFGVLAAGAAICAIIYVIWQAADGPSADSLVDQQNRRDCIAARGTWYEPETGDGSCIIAGTSTK